MSSLLDTTAARIQALAPNFFDFAAASAQGGWLLLEAGGDFRALYCSLEIVQGFEDPAEGLPAVGSCLRSNLRAFGWPDPFAAGPVNTILKAGPSRLCGALDAPLVLLLGEVGCLTEGTLITHPRQRQLRDGYVNSAGGNQVLE